MTLSPFDSVHRAIQPPVKDFSRHLQVASFAAHTALTQQNLRAWSSETSLSSVYSCSISGEGKQGLKLDTRCQRDAGAATVVNPPLGGTRRAQQPAFLVHDADGRMMRCEDDELAWRPLVVTKGRSTGI